jgi:hypothetical protein
MSCIQNALDYKELVLGVFLNSEEVLIKNCYIVMNVIQKFTQTHTAVFTLDFKSFTYRVQEATVAQSV